MLFGLVAALALLGLGAAPSPAPARPPAPSQPLLWVTTTGETASYLFGTIHLPDPRVLDLPPVVLEALDGAEVVTTEIPLDKVSQMKALTGSFLPPGESLPAMLPPPLRRQAEAVLREKGMSLEGFSRLKIWAFTGQFAMLDYLGALRPPLDLWIYQHASAAGKRVEGLETVGEQLGVFDAMTTQEQLTMLELTLGEVSRARAAGEPVAEEVIRAYLAGDLGRMEALMERSAPRDTAFGRKFEKLFLRDRNERMADRIAAHLAAKPPRSFFFAVGALHLAGDHGLPKLLERRGWPLRRVASQAAAPAAVAP